MLGLFAAVLVPFQSLAAPVTQSAAQRKIALTAVDTAAAPPLSYTAPKTLSLFSPSEVVYNKYAACLASMDPLSVIARTSVVSSLDMGNAKNGGSATAQ